MQPGAIRSILVIDDDSDDFELVSEAVREIDPRITVAFLDRCEDAVKYKDQSFDLVLLDINMPHYDGFHWLKGIRENGPENLPVVMFTNSSNPASIAKAYGNGASLYFIKPASFREMITGFRKLMALDWADPVSITQQHRQNGTYVPFEV